jgi:hypothetical protein
MILAQTRVRGVRDNNPFKSAPESLAENGGAWRNLDLPIFPGRRSLEIASAGHPAAFDFT